ncbi:hypothetical protein [Guggenheimella bovis]
MRFALKNYIKKNDKGAVSVFLLILTGLIIILGGVFFEYAYVKFCFQREKTNLYLDLDQAMSAFERPLFQEMGIFAVQTKSAEKYENPLSDRKILERSITELMDQKLLLDGVMLTEDIVNEFAREKLKVKLPILDVQGLNDELQYLIQCGLNGEVPQMKLENFLVKIITSKAYLELEGAPVDYVIDCLEALDFESLKELSPVFVIKPIIRKHYTDLKNALEKYDALNLIGNYELADYAIGYLGYSGTEEQPEKLLSEFLLTGIRDKGLQQVVVGAELYSVRFIMNFAETLSNPLIREKIAAVSFGDPLIALIEQLTLSAGESLFDIDDIFDRREIPLYKGEHGFQIFKGGFVDYPKGLKYQEYLKLLLVVIPKNIYFNNLQTALEENYDIKLSDCYTAAHEKRKITIKGKLIPIDFVRIFEGRLSFVKRID